MDVSTTTCYNTEQSRRVSELLAHVHLTYDDYSYLKNYFNETPDVHKIEIYQENLIIIDHMHVYSKIVLNELKLPLFINDTCLMIPCLLRTYMFQKLSGLSQTTDAPLYTITEEVYSISEDCCLILSHYLNNFHLEIRHQVHINVANSVERGQRQIEFLFSELHSKILQFQLHIPFICEDKIPELLRKCRSRVDIDAIKADPCSNDGRGIIDTGKKEGKERKKKILIDQKNNNETSLKNKTNSKSVPISQVAQIANTQLAYMNIIGRRVGFVVSPNYVWFDDNSLPIVEHTKLFNSYYFGEAVQITEKATGKKFMCLIDIFGECSYESYMSDGDIPTAKITNVQFNMTEAIFERMHIMYGAYFNTLSIVIQCMITEGMLAERFNFLTNGKRVPITHNSYRIIPDLDSSISPTNDKKISLVYIGDTSLYAPVTQGTKKLKKLDQKLYIQFDFNSLKSYLNECKGFIIVDCVYCEGQLHFVAVSDKNSSSTYEDVLRWVEK